MNRREWQIAIPILAGLAACVAGFVHGLQLENSFDGIAAMRAVATPAGARVAVVAANAVHVLDAQGRRLSRQPLKDVGLADSPNDMDLTVDADGRLEAWFFEDADAGPRVIRCAWDGERQRMQACATAASGAQLKWDAHSRAVHLAVDRIGNRMFVADAKGARVQVFDLKGKRLASSDPGALPLFFPNRLRWLGNDRLAIADNDHRRLVWADVKPGAAMRSLETLSSTDHPGLRPRRGKVTDAAFGASGAIWMLAVKQGQKDGDVLVFDAARRPVARAQLPDDADPLVVEALGDCALVADYSLVKIFVVDARGHLVGEFGDGAFRADLAPMQALSRSARDWRTGGFVGGAIVIVLGLVLGWKFSEKPVPKVRAAVADAAASGARAPELAYPVVLDVLPAYRATMRRTIGVVAIVGALSLAGIAAIVGMAAQQNWILWVQAAMFAVAGAAIVRLTWREMMHPVQLRITRSRVGLFRDGECEVEVPLDEVLATDHALQLGRKRLVYDKSSAEMGKFQPMFDVELLRRALIARLPEANLVDDATLNRVMMARQPKWIQVAAIAGVVAVLVVVFRDQLPF